MWKLCFCLKLCVPVPDMPPDTGLVVDWTGEGLQAWQERLAAASGASTVNQLLRKHGIKVGLLLPTAPCHNTVTSLFGCLVAWAASCCLKTDMSDKQHPVMLLLPPAGAVSQCSCK
jgi:hypothetical protein